LTCLAESARQRFEAHCRDLSKAGIGLLVAAELSLGDVVSLSFSLPGTEKALNFGAVLRHRRGFNYGFEFLSLFPEQERALATFLPKLRRADSDEQSNSVTSE
jgi:c-di-GMP-binding flagellar brake protein YcgR